MSTDGDDTNPRPTPGASEDDASEPTGPDMALARAAGWLLGRQREGASADKVYGFLARFGGGEGVEPALAPAGRRLEPGDRLGRFRVEREIGRGGFGVVYRAVDETIDRAVALKVPRHDRVQNEALWEQFARDANLMAKLDDPAIVRVHEAGVVGGVFAVVSELVEGPTLSGEIRANPGGMPPRRAARIGAEIARGLSHAHERRVVHRDLKPGNVLMAPGGPGDEARPRITDFGLGSVLEAGSGGTTMTGMWQGSPPYMAPEQLLPAAGPVGERADVYALGAILYEMLTGQPIYPARSIVELIGYLSERVPPLALRSVAPGVPRDLETICLGCLEPDPARRYPSAAEVAEELGRFLSGRPIARRPLPGWERLARWARREPALAALAGVTAAGVALLAVLAAGLARANDRLRQTVDAERRASADLRASRDDLRRSVYTADLRLAAEALEDGQAEVVQGLLDAHRPRPGEADLREFTWRLMRARATREVEVRPVREFPWAAPVPAGPVGGLHLGFTDLRPGFVARNHGIEAVCFDGSFHGLFPRPAAVAPGPDRLFYTDAHRVVDLGRQAWTVAFGPGRRVALGSLGAIAAEAAVPPARRGRLVIPGPAGESFDLVEVPTALSMDFSADGSLLAVLAANKASGLDEAARCFPVFYDLRDGRSWGLPGLRLPSFFRWPRESGRRGEFEHWAAMAVSADGRLAALAGWNPRLTVFETRTGRRLWSIEPGATGEVGFIGSAAFSPDGRRLVTGDAGERVRVWDAETGALAAEMPRRPGTVSSVGFYPDSSTVLVTRRDDDLARLWRFAAGPAAPTVLHHAPRAEVWDLAFSRDGRVLYSSEDDVGEIKAWDPAAGREISPVRGHGTMVAALAVSPDGSLLASGDYDGRVLARELTGGRPPVEIARAAGTVWSLAWSPDGTRLAICGRFGELLLWERATRVLRHVGTSHTDAHTLAWRPDGNVLAVGSHDEVITFWDPDGMPAGPDLGTAEGVARLAYSPDGTRLVVGDIAGGLQARDASEPQRVLWSVPRASDKGGVWGLAFTGDSRTLATGGDDGFARLWDPSSGREMARLPVHRARVHAVAFSPADDLLATADFSGQIILWRAPAAEGMKGRSQIESPTASKSGHP